MQSFICLNYFFCFINCRGECTIDRIYEYHDNKDKYGKPSKAKKFLEGMQELEQDLDKDEDKTPSITETKGNL